MIKRPLIRAFFMGAVLFVVLKGLGACRAALLLFFRRRTHPGFNSGATPSMATLVTATAQHSLSIYNVCITAISTSKKPHTKRHHGVQLVPLALSFFLLLFLTINSPATSMLNKQLARDAASEPWMASARIETGSLIEGKAPRASCAMHRYRLQLLKSTQQNQNYSAKRFSTSGNCEI